jgi:uncharacterized protein YlzI (FlbEa/FlbD family)
MITVVTIDGKQHIFKDEADTSVNEVVTNAVINGQGFVLSDSTKSIAYAPAGVSRVVIEQ